MTSCERKTHMPSDDASFCCSMSSKWLCRSGWRSPAATFSSCVNGLITVSDKRALRSLRVIVSFFGDHWGLVEIVLVRRRRHLPFQPGSAPRIRPGDLAVLQRPDEVDRRQDVAKGK